jgi:hypothetical protein
MCFTDGTDGPIAVEVFFSTEELKDIDDLLIGKPL